MSINAYVEEVEEKDSNNLINIIDNVADVRSALEAIYYLYAKIRDRDQEISFNTASMAISFLYEKAQELLEEIKNTASELNSKKRGVITCGEKQTN